MNRNNVESFFRNANPHWWNPDCDHDHRFWIFKAQSLYIQNQLKEYCIDLENASALDAGCGRGIHSRLLESLGCKVISFDINASMLELTRKVVRSNLVEGSLMDIPFTRNSFDIIISIGTSMHVASVNRLVSEIHRVLMPGGIAFISMANRLSLYIIWATFVNRSLAARQRLYHRKQFTYWAFRRMICQYGFEIINVKGFAIIPPISLKSDWRGNIINPRISEYLSYPLDRCFGKYFGCGVTFTLRK